MKLVRFLKSPTGNFTVFVLFLAVGGMLILRSNARERAHAAQLTKVETEPAPITETISRLGAPLVIPTHMVIAAKADGIANHDGGQGVTKGRRTKPQVLPISLVATKPSADENPSLSQGYAPYGRLIPCETVVTLESSRLDTPVIGLVTDDVWNDGRLIIPAGAEVHGRASLDRMRERIAASGKWVIVWRDNGPLNGTELVVNGIALDREKDGANGQFGIRDGSAGLRGELLRSDNMQEIKLFASTFLAGMAGGLQQLQNQGTAFGGVAQVPVVSGRNAALQGTADVLNTYAKQIQKAIARDGLYVRVPAGKQFYLYVTQTMDLAKGTRGNVANAEIWRKTHAN